MTAADYPITFGYGATDPPYGTAALPYHKGEDRAMPTGTPVVVNGVTIALSGNTGFSTGSHLHNGRFVNGKDTPPNGGGFTFDNAKVTEIGQDGTNGKFVRVQADGASWVYLHLSKQLVSVGQELKGEDMFNLTKEQIMAISRMATGSYPGKDFDYNKFTGQPASQAVVDELIQTFAPYSEERIGEYVSLQQQVSSLGGDIKTLSPGKYLVK